MDNTRTGVEGDVIAEEYGGRAVIEWVLERDAFQRFSLRYPNDLPLLQCVAVR